MSTLGCVLSISRGPAVGELLEVVQAQDHLRVARQEPVEPRLVPHELLDAGHVAQRPGHLADGAHER